MDAVAIRLEEESKEEQRRKLISALGTLFIITGMLALLWFFGFKYMDPPPPEEGAMVAMGEPDAGNSDDYAQQSPEETPSAPETSEQSTETQDYEEAPTEQETPPKKQAEPTPDKTKPKEDPKPKVNPNTLFESSKKGDGSGKGDGGKPGNQGKPDGTGDDPLGTGIGTSGDGTWMMGNGRKPETKIAASCKFPRRETVVVKIKVDNNGYVSSAECVLKYKTFTATTVESTYCNCAKNAAKAVKFTAKSDAPIQEGAIKFDFKVQ
ncbi:hypothetical protein QQ054_38710 [Oscillatoria amoena NRMC-F 0135]|nr:hypothetical protein [Oscillatoria amoena NRMC-F 0135]